MAIVVDETVFPLLTKIMSPQVLADYCAVTKTTIQQLLNLEELLKLTSDPLQRALIASCILKVSSKNLRQWPYLMKAENIIDAGKKPLKSPTQPLTNAVPGIQRKWQSIVWNCSLREMGAGVLPDRRTR